MLSLKASMLNPQVEHREPVGQDPTNLVKNEVVLSLNGVTDGHKRNQRGEDKHEQRVRDCEVEPILDAAESNHEKERKRGERLTQQPNSIALLELGLPIHSAPRQSTNQSISSSGSNNDSNSDGEGCYSFNGVYSLVQTSHVQQQQRRPQQHC